MSISLEKKVFDFSIRVAELVKYLREDDKNFPLCERMLSCGVGAGLALRGGGTKEAAKLVSETDYIIEMAIIAGYMKKQQGVHIREDCESILKEVKDQQVKTGETVV